MEAPKNCKHYPLVSVDNYDPMDGQYANDTDAKALSIGYAQYNKPGLSPEQREISLKVWRMGDKGWSRMSEELPIHRNLDLTILLLNVLLGEETNSAAPKWKISGDEREKEEIRKYYREHIAILEPRLEEIKKLLNKMK